MARASRDWVRLWARHGATHVGEVISRWCTASLPGLLPELVPAWWGTEEFLRYNRGIASGIVPGRVPISRGVLRPTGSDLPIPRTDPGLIRESSRRSGVIPGLIPGVIPRSRRPGVILG